VITIGVKPLRNFSPKQENLEMKNLLIAFAVMGIIGYAAPQIRAGANAAEDELNTAAARYYTAASDVAAAYNAATSATNKSYLQQAYWAFVAAAENAQNAAGYFAVNDFTNGGYASYYASQDSGIAQNWLSKVKNPNPTVAADIALASKQAGWGDNWSDDWSLIPPQ